jgi:hypothetical protein
VSKYFLGVDHGIKSVGAVMVVEGQEIGLVRSFEIKRPRVPITPLPEGIYEIPGPTSIQIPLKRFWVDELALRRFVLDCEYSKAPARCTWPQPKGRR